MPKYYVFMLQVELWLESCGRNGERVGGDLKTILAAHAFNFKIFVNDC